VVSSLLPEGQALQVPLESVQSKTSPAGEHLQISPATAVASASLQAVQVPPTFSKLAEQTQEVASPVPSLVALAQATQVLLAAFLYSLAAQLAPQVGVPPVDLKKLVAHSQSLVLSVAVAPAASTQLLPASHIQFPSTGEFSINPAPVQQAVGARA